MEKEKKYGKYIDKYGMTITDSEKTKPKLNKATEKGPPS